MQRLINSFLKNKIYKDFILNIIASIIYTISTQFIAYPFLSRIVSMSEYGMILTLMGIANTFGVAIGNPLNNTKILMHSEYDDLKEKGDFNILFVCGLVFNAIIVFSFGLFFDKINFFVILGLVAVSMLIIFRAYYTVSYRIYIDYKKNLYTSLFAMIGYVFGIILTYITGIWVLTFLSGELFSCLYILRNSKKLINEKFLKSPIFTKTLKKYIFIMSGVILSTAMSYMDRFFVFPILGAKYVSIYNVSSFLGKTAGLIMTPISGVLLTYYAKESFITLKQFYKRLGIFTLFAIVFYIGILSLGMQVTGLLYPTIVRSVLPFFRIANLATTIFILGNTIQPTLIRFCDVKWQPIIQIIYLVIYLILGILGMRSYGLRGFIYAVLIANTTKILIMVYITTLCLKNNNI